MISSLAAVGAMMNFPLAVLDVLAYLPPTVEAVLVCLLYPTV